MTSAGTLHGDLPRVLFSSLLVALILGGCASESTTAIGSPTTEAEVASSAATTEPVETTSTTVAKALDPCDLVTQAEAEALAQTPLDPITSAGSTLCYFSGPTTGPTASIQILAGDGVKTGLDVDRSLEHEFTTLSGIGDEAYLQLNSVFIRKGDQWVQLNIVLMNVSQDQIQSGLTALAAAVAGRM